MTGETEAPPGRDRNKSAPAAHEMRPRRISQGVHLYLQDRIVDGELPPHSILSQAEVARTLGVSRGPVREAFRRLQEQGLILAEANQRPRVAGFEPDSLDSLYAVRIMVEALGAQVSCTVATEELVAQMHALLNAMAAVEDTSAEWRTAHRAFHGAVVSGAGEIVREHTIALAGRSEPYYKLYGGNRAVGDADHKMIVEAFEAHDPDLAMQRHARHVARTALSVLSSMSPEYEPVKIRSSLKILGLLNASDPG